MFAKPDSSLFGTGKKKGKEVALRKSDRRNLRKRVLETLLLPQPQEGDNQSSSSCTLTRVIDDIFLQGTIVQRPLVHTDYKKVTLYLRSPSSSDSASENNDDDDSCIVGWPYTVHSQVVWMELDVSASETLQVPTIALLSVLMSTQAAQASQASQSPVQPVQPLLPTIAVPSAVTKNLCRGAHLMKAGIFQMPHPPLVPRQDSATARRLLQAPPRQERLVALTVVSAASGSNTTSALQQQPFAVGLLHDSIQSVSDVGPGTKGLGVEILTCYGDDFWRLQSGKQSHSTTTTTSTSSSIISSLGGAPFDAGHYGNVGFVNGECVVPITVHTKDKGEGEGDEESAPGAAAVETKKTAWDDDGKAADATVEEATKVEHTAVAGGGGDDDDDDVTREVDHDEPPESNTASSSTMTPDEVLHESVCRALVALHPAKQFLPMTMANFYANHVLKHRPEGTTIELKKTTYKKFGHYIQEQVARQLIEAGPAPKNSSGGKNDDPLAMLNGYNRRHADLEAILLQAKDLPPSDPSDASNSSRRRKLVLVDLYRIPSQFVSLLRLDKEAVSAAQAASEQRRNTGFLTGKEVRAILENYIVREQLVDASMRGMVHLDGPLTDALFPTSKKNKDSNSANSKPPPATMSRKDLVVAWQSKMQGAYALVEMPGNAIVQMNRGKPTQVTITVTKRQNRKFVTRVRGVEEYGVDAMEFKTNVAHRLACAASVEENPSEKLKKGHVELAFQGNLQEELQALLLGDESMSSHGGVAHSDYQLPKNSVKVILRKGVPGQRK